jgi:uncharacterized protein YjbI with pentapeptide repeats
VQRQATIRKQETKRALIVGVSKYDNLRSLKFCENDGKAMVNLLEKKLGYQVTRLIGKVTWLDIRKYVIDFFIYAGSRDILLFYFSGHGIMDKSARPPRYYLAPSDIDPSDRADTTIKGFPFDELEQRMRDTISNRIVAILDCCHSGAVELRGRRETKGSNEAAAEEAAQAAQAINGKADAVKKKIRSSGKGIAILSACLDSQEAESTTKRDYSIFTHYLLEGLRGNDNGHVDKNGNITASSLGNYIYYQVTNHEPREERPKQRPIIKTELSGDIILAHYPDKVKQETTVSEHEIFLKLLQQGKITEFNKKKNQDPYKSIDLHEVNLARANLQLVNLKRANLAKADLRGVNLRGALLIRSGLMVADLSRAILIEANLNGADLMGANLQRVNLGRAKLYRANLVKANLGRASLEWAGFVEADLSQSDLTGANLSRANLRKANLRRANLKKTNLEGAFLWGATLSGANLEEAELLEATLEKALLFEANLREAKLREANLWGADLRRVNLSGANLRGANLEKADLEKADLRHTKNLPISVEEARNRGAIV